MIIWTKPNLTAKEKASLEKTRAFAKKLAKARKVDSKSSSLFQRWELDDVGGTPTEAEREEGRRLLRKLLLPRDTDA